MTRWLDDDEQRVWRGLLAVMARLPAEMNRELVADAGLSLQDFDVLVQLTDDDAGPGRRVRVSALADALGWERSRLSHHLKRMTARGLVEREECDDDRRGSWVLLTEAGRSAIEAAAPDHVETVRRLVFDGLSPADLTALAAITGRILDRL